MHQTAEEYIKDLNINDKSIIKALKFAHEKHKTQYRESGEPYFTHLIWVYQNLKDWGIKDTELLQAALLHDAVEDTNTKISTIKKEFGDEVAFLVANVTKMSMKNKEERDQKALQQLISGTYINPKVAILKLADRCHNLSTLQYTSAKSRNKKAREGLEIFAKLAEALGIWEVKNLIENYAFEYYDFEKYSKVKEKVEKDKRLEEHFIASYRKEIKNAVDKNKIPVKEISIKRVSYYEIYEKLKYNSTKGISSYDNYEYINDIVSFRVIVKDVKSCYTALQSIHNHFGDKVDYNRFDEFIGDHKRTNGYEAIQTTLNTEYGAIEIAIMTKEMEEFNNWGYIYRLKNKQKTNEYNLILAFTPKMDLKFLPKGAKAIDFTYAINKKLGNSTTKVVINDKKENLDYSIKNGDIIKAVTGKRSIKHDRELLEIVLPETKNHIKEKIVQAEKLDFINQGQKMVMSRLAPRGLLDLKDLDTEYTEMVYLLGCENYEEIYYKIAKGYLDIDRLDDALNANNITKNRLGWTSILVEGKDKMGLLKRLTKVINDCKGNIIRISFEKHEAFFNLRIVAEKIQNGDIHKIEEHLKKVEKVESFLVV